MSIRQTGAEFARVTSNLPTDLVELQRYDTNISQYSTRNIAVSDLLATNVPQAIQVYVPVISAQAGAVSVLFVAPFDGAINSVRAAISGPIITSNIVITPRVYHLGSATAVTNGAVTIPFSGSAIGTSASATPTAANTFVAGDTITATITGGVNSVNGVITLLITRTA